MPAPPKTQGKTRNPEVSRLQIAIGIEGVPDSYQIESSIDSVNIIESLLSPSIHTAITVRDPIYYTPDNGVKDLNKLKNKKIIMEFYKPDTDRTLRLEKRIYRIDNRFPTSNQLEMYNVNCIDDDALSNAKKRMANYFKCKTPSFVVQAAMDCVGVKNRLVQESQPPRNYSATNIHPYQVISEQADAALDGDDPSFVHYMTTENITGTHYFKSIKSMASTGSIETYTWTEKGSEEGNYGNPTAIIAYEFPCDFDLLSDLLNGLDENGKPTNSSGIYENIQNGISSLYGNQSEACGMGGGQLKFGMTDFGGSENCDINVQKYMHIRQARISLLEQDKIGLRIVVPFNPDLNAGKVITANFESKKAGGEGLLEYGSGDYLICSMTHAIQAGGYATTTLDCVATTVAEGEL